MGFSSLDHGWDDSAAHPVGSSNMLLGGFGFLGRLHGLSIDNLVEVEMVLADGRIVVVNENSYPGKPALPLFSQVQVSSHVLIHRSFVGSTRGWNNIGRRDSLQG